MTEGFRTEEEEEAGEAVAVAVAVGVPEELSKGSEGCKWRPRVETMEDHSGHEPCFLDGIGSQKK